MTVEPHDWGELAELRQALYRFFGGSFLAPDGERLAAVTAAAAVLADSGIDDFAFASQWWALAKALDHERSAGVLEGEYLRLFMAGTDGALCPPLESQYLAAPRRSATRVVEVQRAYAELDVAVRPGLPYAADHLATELEAMAATCHREAHAWEEGLVADAVGIVRLEWSFLDRHLARWLPLFTRRLHDVTTRGFYASLAAAADAFVRHDHELVSSLARARLAGLTS